MKILAVDDEKPALELLVETLEQVCPKAEILGFNKASELLEYAEKSSFDIVFLDIQMRGITGIELAKRLKEKQKETNIIFVTGYGEYVSTAMQMHASGYIEKPVTAEQIRREISDLRYKNKDKDSCLKIKCFGNFDVYAADDEPLYFERSKAKELLAYLVLQKGSGCTNRQIAAVLFEDTPYDKKQQDYVQKIIASLIKALRAQNAEDALIKEYNSLSLRMDKVDCDYYRFLNGEADAVNNYQGIFMTQYAWAEDVVAYLDQLYQKRNH